MWLRIIGSWLAATLLIAVAWAAPKDILLLGVGSGAGGGGSCCTLVNKVYVENISTAVTSLSATAISVTGGNLLVVFCRDGSSASQTDTVTDTASNTFTQFDVGAFGGNNQFIGFYAKNVTGNASDVITCNYASTTSFTSVNALQYSGANASAPLDAHANGESPPGSASYATASFSTGTAKEMAVCGGSIGATGNTFTAGSGYTLESTNTSMSFSEDQQFNSTQSGVTCTASGPNSNFAIVVGTFK